MCLYPSSPLRGRRRGISFLGNTVFVETCDLMSCNSVVIYVIQSFQPSQDVASKHDHNIDLDLFVCNPPIKQNLSISISGFPFQRELPAEPFFKLYEEEM